MWSKRAPLSDEEAKRIVSELYEAKYDTALDVIDYYLGNQIGWDEKHDLVQEGFVRLIEHADSLKHRNPKERVRYMKRTMRNLAIDEGRKRSRRRALGFPNVLETEDWKEICAEEPTPEEQYIADETRREMYCCLRAALDRLSSRDYDLITEKYGNLLSEKEIGEKLDIPEQNVGTYLSRARKRMAKYYLEERERARKAREEEAKERQEQQKQTKKAKNTVRRITREES